MNHLLPVQIITGELSEDGVISPCWEVVPPTTKFLPALQLREIDAVANRQESGGWRISSPRRVFEPFEVPPAPKRYRYKYDGLAQELTQRLTSILGVQPQITVYLSDQR